MKHSPTSALFVMGILLLILAGTMSLSRSTSAAEKVGAEATASAAPAASDGTLFLQFVSVLRHPRCMNCHSRGDFPRQGDDGHQHTMNVRRGVDGHGVAGVKCSSCHQDHNLTGEHVPPGAPGWHLPSVEMPMIWEELTDRQLCEL